MSGSKSVFLFASLTTTISCATDFAFAFDKIVLFVVPTLRTFLL